MLRQVTRTDEERVYENMEPEAIADVVFDMMRNFPTKPVDMQLTAEQVIATSFCMACVSNVHEAKAATCPPSSCWYLRPADWCRQR